MHRKLCRTYPILIQTLWMQYAPTMALFSQKHRARDAPYERSACMITHLRAMWARFTPSTHCGRKRARIHMTHVGLGGDLCVCLLCAVMSESDRSAMMTRCSCRTSMKLAPAPWFDVRWISLNNGEVFDCLGSVADDLDVVNVFISSSFVTTFHSFTV